MKIFKLVTLILFFCFVSCKKEMTKPDNLIPREEMKSIIKDIYIYNNLNQNNFSRKERLNPTELNLTVLEKHQIPLEQFQTSYQYYVVDNAAYDELLVEIKEELNQNQEK